MSFRQEILLGFLLLAVVVVLGIHGYKYLYDFNEQVSKEQHGMPKPEPVIETATASPEE